MFRVNALGSVFAIALVLAACGPASAPASPSRSSPEPPPATAASRPTAVATSAAPSALSPILTAQLTDVRTGDGFTLGSFATQVVIVEGMAVW
jgi:hypothetical protein